MLNYSAIATFANQTVDRSTFPITLKLFAAYQEAVGTEELAIDITTGMTALDVCDLLIAKYPGLAKWKAQTQFGVNLDFVPAETELRPGDELVLIPPVSGG